MNGRYRRRILSISVGILLLLGALPASGQVVLMTIRGYVRDLAQTPLAQVTVTDGSKVVYTNPSGYYELTESRIDTYRVTVSKTGLNTQSCLVTPADSLSEQNFSMSYVAGVSVSPANFNNNPPKTLDVTFTSYAPTSSCVDWTDATTGQVVRLSLSNAVPGGSSTWSGQFAVPAGSVDAAYPTSAVAKSPDCATSLTSTLTISISRTCSRGGGNVPNSPVGAKPFRV